jgi:hypothetical protein
VSEARFGPFFPGMIPVEGWTVGQAYKRALLGAQTGRVYKVQRTPERELLPMAEGFGLAVNNTEASEGSSGRLFALTDVFEPRQRW